MQDVNKKGFKFPKTLDKHIIELVQKHGEDFEVITSLIGGRYTVQQIKKRYKDTLASDLCKGNWTKEEDALLLEAIGCVQREGKELSREWQAIAQCVVWPQGRRTQKQCRERWVNQLDPQINHEPFTVEENNTIIKHYLDSGPRWAAMKRFLPGRSDNQIKNHFNSTLKKELAHYRTTISPPLYQSVESIMPRARGSTSSTSSDGGAGDMGNFSIPQIQVPHPGYTQATAFHSPPNQHLSDSGYMSSTPGDHAYTVHMQQQQGMNHSLASPALPGGMMRHQGPYAVQQYPANTPQNTAQCYQPIQEGFSSCVLPAHQAGNPPHLQQQHQQQYPNYNQTGISVHPSANYGEPQISPQGSVMSQVSPPLSSSQPSPQNIMAPAISPPMSVGQVSSCLVDFVDFHQSSSRPPSHCENSMPHMPDELTVQNDGAAMMSSEQMRGGTSTLPFRRYTSSVLNEHDTLNLKTLSALDEAAESPMPSTVRAPTPVVQELPAKPNFALDKLDSVGPPALTESPIKVIDVTSTLFSAIGQKRKSRANILRKSKRPKLDKAAKKTSATSDQTLAPRLTTPNTTPLKDLPFSPSLFLVSPAFKQRTSTPVSNRTEMPSPNHNFSMHTPIVTRSPTGRLSLTPRFNMSSPIKTPTPIRKSLQRLQAVAQQMNVAYELDAGGSGSAIPFTTYSDKENAGGGRKTWSRPESCMAELVETPSKSMIAEGSLQFSPPDIMKSIPPDLNKAFVEKSPFKLLQLDVPSLSPRDHKKVSKKGRGKKLSKTAKRGVLFEATLGQAQEQPRPDAVAKATSLKLKASWLAVACGRSEDQQDMERKASLFYKRHNIKESTLISVV